MPKFYKKLSDIKNMYLIKKSGYFDYDYYGREYSDVKGNLLKHYYYYGYKLGYNPSDKFNNNRYLKKNSDVRSAKVNPLLHYIVCGEKEGRIVYSADGFSVKKLYESFFYKMYCYDIYKNTDDNKRINLFIDGIFEYSFDEIVVFLNFIFKKCKEEDTILRIFYKELDFDKLDKVLSLCDFKMYSNIFYVLINDNYFLEFGSNDIIFCVDFFQMYALVNSSYINLPIYYLIDKNIDFDSDKKVLLSFLIKMNLINCLSVGNFSINDFSLEFRCKEKINIKNIDSLLIDFGNLVINSMELLNDYFGNNNYNIKLYYKSSKGEKKFYLDNRAVVWPFLDDCVDYKVRFLENNDDYSLEDKTIDIFISNKNKKIKIINIINEDVVLDKKNIIKKRIDNIFNDIFVEDDDNV